MPVEPNHRRFESRFTGKFSLVMGILFVATAAICNQWLLGYFLSPDGNIDDPADLLIIWCFQGTLFLWGGLNLLFRRRGIIAKINLLLISLGLISPLVAECLIRGAIALGVPAFRNPGLYADALSDDDYWKLQFLWSERPENPRVVQDPILGWAPRETPENPLGVIADKPYRINLEQPAILFYGDSFVDSPVGPPNTIPDLLARQESSIPVYNYGVQGYGVDQIFLRFQESHEQFEHPYILLGIMTSDLDRCVLKFRGAPKPYFVVQDGQLVLQGTPITATRSEWVRDHGVHIWSYLYSFVDMRIRLHQPGNLREASGKQKTKEKINSLLLKDLVDYCHAHDLPLKFVLFYDPEELTETGWREEFLRDQLRQLHADYVDTKPLLIERARQKGVDIWSFYRADHHLNARGNQIVARSVAEALSPWIAKRAPLAKTQD